MNKWHKRREWFTLACFFALTCAKTSNEVETEPQFPNLLDPLRGANWMAHIVSDVVDLNEGRYLLEEYIDMRTGQSATVKIKDGIRSTILCDQDLIYQYTPYKCNVIQTQDGLDGVVDAEPWWNAKVAVMDQETGEKVEMHSHGIIALWLNAAELSKSMSIGEIIHSPISKKYIKTYMWTLNKLADSKEQVSMHFSESSADDGSDDEHAGSASRMNLELIQVRDLEGKLLRTINILGLDHWIGDETRDNVLQPPIGYGCHHPEKSMRVHRQRDRISRVILQGFSWYASLLDFELTLTQVSTTGGARISETTNIKLSEFGSVCVRKRDTYGDIKVVTDLSCNVKYTIDLSKGSCEREHSDWLDKNQKQVYYFLRFRQADFELQFSHELVDLLLSESLNFEFIRSVKRADGAYLLSIERTIDPREEHDVFGDSQAIIRIVRTYLLHTDGSSELGWVRVWYLERSDPSKLIRSLQLTLIEKRSVDLVEVARVFDISDACYLNDEHMMAGKDYAWIRVLFPLSRRTLSHILLHYPINLLRGLISASLSQRSGFNLLRIPKVELEIGESSLVARILLLDIPKLTDMYNEIREKQLTLTQRSDKQKPVEEIVPDLDHCEQMCRIYGCWTMSFNSMSHSCRLSVQKNGAPLEESPGTVTYDRPTNLIITNEMELHKRLSIWLHADYSQSGLPNEPEEIQVPQEESGLDEQSYRDTVERYLADLRNSLAKLRLQGDSLLVDLWHSGDHSALILYPSRVEIEHDPMHEFDIFQEGTQNRNLILDNFHQGLAMMRYKARKIADSGDTSVREFTLSYDQCALSCIDARCNSFSYCTHTRQCIITETYDISLQLANGFTEQDSDCVILRRDYLAKFNKFQRVYRPGVYRRYQKAGNPSECARSCVMEKEFRCLAFDYCERVSSSSNGEQAPGSCYFLETREFQAGRDNHKKASRETGCDHFSRSYLADFLMVQYKRIEPDYMARHLQTSEANGLTLDQCASQCILESTDCTAFQFCFDDERSIGPRQHCTLIEGLLGRPQAAEIDEITNASSSKTFIADRSCHVFSLRRDTAEVTLRVLAFNSSETNGDLSSTVRGSPGLTLGGMLILYGCMTALFSVLGVMIFIVRRGGMVQIFGF